MGRRRGRNRKLGRQRQSAQDRSTRYDREGALVVGDEPAAARWLARRTDRSQPRRQRDPFRIRPLRGGRRKERHTIVGPGGETRTFEIDGPAQRVFDGEGRILSESAWTPEGPESQAIVQPAFAPAAPAAATIELGLTLFGWFAGRNSASEQAVLAFRAFDYAPSDLSGLELGFVGMLDRDEVDAACPRHPEVRSRTDRANDAVVKAGGKSLPPAVFGTLVHTNLKRQIEALRDPNFIAEKSLLKSRRAARYGQRGSIRIDVLERVGNGVVCVYDIKTGDAKLTQPRVAEIARNVGKNYPEANRIIVIETKPSKK